MRKLSGQLTVSFPIRSGRGVSDLIKGTPKRTRKNSKAKSRANRDVKNLKKEIELIKQFSKDKPRGLVYKVWGGTLLYPVKGRNDQKKIAMIMDQAFEDLFQLLQDKNIGSVFFAFAEDILLGIQYLHKKGLIHRDVKTENILVFKASADKEYELRICDFGSVIEDKPPFGDTNCGTFEYISPETLESILLEDKLTQIFAKEKKTCPKGKSSAVFAMKLLKEKKITGENAVKIKKILTDLVPLKLLSSKPRDIFSLGIVLHEMFTGNIPDFNFYEETVIKDPDTGKIVDYIDPKNGKQGSYLKIKKVENKLHDSRNDYALPSHIEDVKAWYEKFDPGQDFLPEGYQLFDDLDEDQKLEVLSMGELVRDMCHWDPEKTSYN